MPKIDPERLKKAVKLLKKQAFQTNPTQAIWDELLDLGEKLDVIIKGKGEKIND